MTLSAAHLAARTALARIMASNIKMFATMLALGVKIPDHDSIGGSRWRTARVIFHNFAGGRCVACRQPVSLTVPASSPDASTIGSLIPCAMIGRTGDRMGAVAGNLATFCRACVDLSNTARKDGAVYVWPADGIDSWRVMLIFPSLPKTRGPAITTASTVDPITYRANSRRINALRGNVFTN